MIVLDRCREPCRGEQTGSGLVTWATTYAMHGYVIRTGRRFSRAFRTPIAGRDLFNPVQHTARHVFVNVPRSEPLDYRVVKLRWR